MKKLLLSIVILFSLVSFVSAQNKPKVEDFQFTFISKVGIENKKTTFLDRETVVELSTLMVVKSAEMLIENKIDFVLSDDHVERILYSAYNKENDVFFKMIKKKKTSSKEFDMLLEKIVVQGRDFLEKEAEKEYYIREQEREEQEVGIDPMFN